MIDLQIPLAVSAFNLVAHHARYQLQRKETADKRSSSLRRRLLVNTDSSTSRTRSRASVLEITRDPCGLSSVGLLFEMFKIESASRWRGRLKVQCFFRVTKLPAQKIHQSRLARPQAKLPSFVGTTRTYFGIILHYLRSPFCWMKKPESTSDRELYSARNMCITFIMYQEQAILG